MQEELNRKLLRLTAIRMLVLVSIALVTILFRLDTVFVPGSERETFSYFVAFFSVQSLIYIALIQLLKNQPRVQAYVQLFGDLLFVTLLILKLDAPQFSALYIVVIGIAAIFLYRTEVLVVAGVAWLMYIPVAWQWKEILHFGPSPPIPQEMPEILRLFYNLTVHLVGFYGIAILTSYLKRAQQALHATNLDLSYLRGLHADVIR